MNSEVQIAIEATHIPESVKMFESVHTGDANRLWLYVLVVSVTLAVIIRCVRKRRKHSILIVAILFACFMLSHTSYAAETTKNVDVTVPSNLSIVFEEDGTTSVSEFTISNNMIVPISICNIHIATRNGWALCESDNNIPVDAKQLEFQIEQFSMSEEDNIVDIPIDYQTNRTLEVQIRRGAWTTSHESEAAFELEFEYELRTREFQLTFDENGSKQEVDDQMVHNGSSVGLPVVFLEGYEFLGWEDKYGILYTNKYQMPRMDSCLKAKWREICGHAIYLKSDQSLRFVKLSEPLLVGDLYDGQEVAAVYPIPMDKVFQSVNEVVWYDKCLYDKTVIKKVIVEDVIQPCSTAYWFCNMEDCEEFDLEKLDTSQVTDMSNMFAWAGYNVKNLEIKGLSQLDVSNVHYMKYMFAYMGYNVDKLNINLQPWNVMSVFDMSYMFTYMAYNAYDLDVGIMSRWKVHNVTNMTCMFRYTGFCANWYVYLSPWDVSKVTEHLDFNYGVTSKVYAPKWVH